MSQKSTARTGSEGDAEFKDIRHTNRQSRSSSCKSKRDIFGGPFGDSPFDQAQDAYQDYLLVMIHNDDNPASQTGSDSSQGDLDLYNLRNNYTQQLNLVRKKLNLMELSEEEHQRCTITEIREDIPDKPKQEEKTEKESSSSPQRRISNETTFNETNRPKGYELTTIHPFSLNYNIQSESSTNTFEPDYSPPQKKVCQRLKTPRFVSLSEASVPYYTQVGTHDSLFRNENNPQLQKKSNNFVKNVCNPFTETRETQCNEEEFKGLNSAQCIKREYTVSTIPECNEDKFLLNLSFESDTESEDEKPNSGVLFPNVIIQTKNDFCEESSLSSQSSKVTKNYTTTTTSNKDSDRKARYVLPLNSVRGSSDDDTYTVTRSSTTVDTSHQKKKTGKKRQRRKSKSSSRENMTMWEEITRLRSGTDDNKVEKGGSGDAVEVDDLTYNFHKINNYVCQLSENIQLRDLIQKESEKSVQGDSKSKLNQYIRQYVQYKREVEKAKTSSATKHAVIGQKVTNLHNRFLETGDKLPQSGTSLVSNEDKYDIPSSPDSSDRGGRRRFWERFCLCLCPNRNKD